MKLINIFLLALTMLISSICSAEIKLNNTTCSPSVSYNYVQCDPGYSGKKYTTTTITCPTEWPAGLASTTTSYNISQCVKLVTPPPIDRTCELTPAACAPQPNSPGCPVGKHWTLSGSAVAHCVENDSVCPRGTSLKHDSLGNPSCVVNTCSSNKVLQSDGISCACPAGTDWNGGSCALLPPTCTASVVKGGNVACDTGYYGFKFGVTTTSCPGNVVTFAWNTSGCTAIPPPPVCPATKVTIGSCPTNYSGYTTITTSYSGASCTVSTTTDLSTCTPQTPSCTNGAKDYPVCTLPCNGVRTSHNTMNQCWQEFLEPNTSNTACVWVPDYGQMGVWGGGKNNFCNWK